jgi:hypothetical protein
VRPEEVREWRLIWEVWNRNPALKQVIHLRNKEIAHLSFLDPNIPKPLISQLFDISEETARELYQLARVLRCNQTDMDFDRNEQRKSAEAFWGIWKCSPSDSTPFSKNESESRKSTRLRSLSGPATLREYAAGLRDRLLRVLRVYK